MWIRVPCHTLPGSLSSAKTLFTSKSQTPCVQTALIHWHNENQPCYIRRRNYSTRDRHNLEEICRTGNVPKHFNFASDVFDRHVIERPSSIALWMESETQSQQWSFARLHKESIRASISLNNVLEIGRTPPKRPPVIFTVLPRVPEWWFLHLASIRVGAVFCPATTQLTSQDIAYRLAASQAEIIITDPQNMWKIEAATRSGKYPHLKKIVVGEGMSATDWIQYHDLTSTVDDSDVLKFKAAHTKSSSIAQMFFTSGTSGKPKLVAHSHSSYGIGHYLTAKLMQLKQDDVVWNISDPGWAKSSYSSFFAPFIAGSTVYVHQMQRVEPKKVLQTLCNLPITTMCAPPTLYRFMVQQNDSSLFQFQKLQNCFAAGEALNPEVCREWKRKCGLTVHEYYGQTETTGIGAYPTSEKKKGAIGKVEGYDIRIVDENGVEVESNQEGHIALKIKPNRPVGLFSGYVKTDSKDLEVDNNMSCFVGDYYLTGDRGYLDDDGFLYLVGRSDDVIISSGYRIGPYEVESVLLTHDAVVESAVVGKPDKDRGSVVKAFIVLNEKYRDNEQTALIENIQEYVRSQTAPYKYPREITFVNELPKTVSGKILRRELRAAV